MKAIKSLFNQRLVKDFSIVFGGTLWAQIINFGFFFVYPFLYPKDSFAYYGVFISSILIISTFINLKMNNLVMIVNDQEENEVLYSGIKIGLIISLLIILLSIILPIDSYLNWIGICLIGISIKQPINIWLNKKGKYRTIIYNDIIQVFISGVTSILFILIFKNEYGLIYGYSIGVLIASLILLFIYPFKFEKLKNVPVKEVFKTHYKFNTFITISSFINTLSRNSVIYILYYFFSTSLVGQFVYLQKLLQVPVGVYTQSLAKIYYKEVSQTRSRALLKLTKTILFINIIIGFLAVIVAYIGSYYFEYFFQKNWTNASIIIKYLSLWVFITILVEPISSYLEVRYKVFEKLYYNIFLFVVRVGSVIFASIYLSFVSTVLVFSLAGFFCNLLLLVYILKEINNEARN